MVDLLHSFTGRRHLKKKILLRSSNLIFITSLRIIPLILLLSLSILAQVTDACRCVSSWGLQKSYHEKGMEVMKVKVLASIQYKTNRKYIVRVIKNYSNARGVGTGDFIFISSAMTSCEMYLKKETWVVATKKSQSGGPAMYSSHSCDFHKQWKSLESEELAFLNTRMICDRTGCKCADGSGLFYCFKSPCAQELTNNLCSDNTCTANYCGGCRAEYTDDIGIFQCQCMRGDPTCPATKT